MSETDTTTVQPDGVDDTDGVEDFDAFWQGRTRRGKRVRIFGQVVELPPALPLQFELEAKRLQRSKSDKDVRTLVTLLFGEGAVERWAQAGMDYEQFQVLLAWAPRVISGQDVSLEDVAEQVAKLSSEYADPTKPPKRKS